MELWKHFLISTIICLILFPFLKYYSLLVFISGFLIDIDHISSYWIRFHKIELNFMKIYRWCCKIGKEKDCSEYKKLIKPFHNVETLILLIVLNSFLDICFH